MTPEQIFVLDASAIINLKSIDLSIGELVTTPKILEELKDYHSRLIKESGIIKVFVPEKENLEKIINFAKERNFDKLLSPADIEVLALSYELKQKGYNIILLTDDYTLQNIAKMLEIPFRSIIRGEIKKVIKKFRYFCPICKKVVKEEICPRCGSKCKLIK